MNKVIHLESIAWKINNQSVDFSPVIKDWSAFTETIINCKKNKISVKKDLVILNFLEIIRRKMKLSEEEMYFKSSEQKLELKSFIELIKEFDRKIIINKDFDKLIGIYECIAVICDFQLIELLDYLALPAPAKLDSVSKHEVANLFLKIPPCIFKDKYQGKYALLLNNDFFIDFARNYLDIQENDLIKVVDIIDKKRANLDLTPMSNPHFILSKRIVKDIVNEFLTIKNCPISIENQDQAERILFKNDSEFKLAAPAIF